MDRREFLMRGLMAVAGGAFAGGVAAAAGGAERPQGARQLARRKLGPTGHRDGIVAFGGIVVRDEPQERANEMVAYAIAHGVNHFDVAPTYGDAEVKLGEALKPYRKNIFLACKTEKRTRKEAAEALRQSLERLQTDYVDLYQFHALDDPKDVETVLGPDGALKAFIEAREKGLIRHIGMTTHRPENLLAVLKRFPIETAMFPINFVIFMRTEYGKRVLEELAERGVGIIAIKPIAARRWREGEPRRWRKCWYKPLDDARQIDLAVRWTLELPVTTIIPSGHFELFQMALQSALDFRPLSGEERNSLRELASTLTPLFGAS